MSSRVKVELCKARNAARGCLNNIKDNRNKYLDKKIESLKKSIISKLFRRSWTDDQFKDLAILREEYSTVSSYKMLGWRLEIEANEILNMCKISSDLYIEVDEEKANLIARWS